MVLLLFSINNCYLYILNFTIQNNFSLIYESYMKDVIVSNKSYYIKLTRTP